MKLLNINSENMLNNAIYEVLRIKWTRKKSTKIINQLEKIANRGKRFQLKSIADIYFHPQSDKEMKYAKWIIKRCLLALKKRFKKQGTWFGSINKNNYYGFILTKEEYFYVKNRRLKVLLGNIRNCLSFMEEARIKKL